MAYFVKNKTKKFNFLYGFLILLGTNQILLTPCILLHTSFKIPLYLTAILNVFLVIISFFVKEEKSKVKIDKNQIHLIIIVSVLILIQIVLTTMSYKENADDSYYVSLSLTNIDSEAIYMTEPSMGEKIEGKVPYDATELIPTFELQIANWAKIFSISPTIICHSLLPMIVIFIAYLAYYYLAQTFFEDNKYAKIFLIILAVLFLFTGFSNRFRPGYLLTRTWQGKTLFFNIGLTVIIASLIKMDKEVQKKDIIILFLANLFSISLTSTAIYLISFTYIAFGLLKLIQCKWKDIIYLIISFIPVIIYVLILFIIIKSSEGALTVDRENVNIFEAVKYYKNYTFLGYYLISTLVIITIGNKDAKRYFGFVQLINLLTIWNPIFSNIIAKYFTSSATFWRVLLLVPIEFAIAYGITIGMQKEENPKLKKGILAGSLLIIIISGKFVYDFKFAENLENIPQEIIDQTNYITHQSKEDNEIIVLSPQEPLHSCTMRQIDTRINLIHSRTLYTKKIPVDEQQERLNLAKIYRGEYIYNANEFCKLVNKYNVDWIITDKTDGFMINYFKEAGFEVNCEIGGYILYKVSNIW